MWIINFLCHSQTIPDWFRQAICRHDRHRGNFWAFTGPRIDILAWFYWYQTWLYTGFLPVLFIFYQCARTCKFCGDWHDTVNSLQLSDAIWHCRFSQTLAQVMAGYLTAPSHYLKWTNVDSWLVRFCVGLSGIAFTKSPCRKGLGKEYKGLETLDVSSPILCCFLGQLWQNFTKMGLEITTA